MIPVHPKIAQRNGAPRTGLRVQKHLCDFGQPFRKIGQQLGCDLAFISARSLDPRHRHIFLFCWGTHPAGAYSSSISSVKRLCCFMPEAPSSVRMAFAVRPCRPITFPKSSGCTRSSTVVACGPSIAATFTSSGWSTRALAITSTSSFIKHLLQRRVCKYEPRTPLQRRVCKYKTRTPQLPGNEPNTSLDAEPPVDAGGSRKMNCHY